MISPDLKALATRFARTTWILWFGFTFAPVIYAVLQWVLVRGRPEGTPPRMPSGSALPEEAIYVAILVAIISGPVLAWVVIPRMYPLAKLIASGQAQLVGNFGEDQPRYERLSETEKKKAGMFGAIQTLYIIRWACVESVAIYGFVAFMMGVADMYTAWGFIVASIVLLVMLRPNYEAELEKLPN